MGDFSYGNPIRRGTGNNITVGKFCQIAEGVIMDGVKIGDGAIIGMRAIITKDVSPYSVVVGAPQRLLRYRYDGYTIARLVRLKWWDKPISEIKEIAPLLMSENIEGLLKHYKL